MTVTNEDSKTPGAMMHICNPSDFGDLDQRIINSGPASAIHQDPKLLSKGQGDGSSLLKHPKFNPQFQKIKKTQKDAIPQYLISN